MCHQSEKKERKWDISCGTKSYILWKEYKNTQWGSCRGVLEHLVVRGDRSTRRHCAMCWQECKSFHQEYQYTQCWATKGVQEHSVLCNQRSTVTLSAVHLQEYQNSAIRRGEYRNTQWCLLGVPEYPVMCLDRTVRTPVEYGLCVHALDVPWENIHKPGVWTALARTKKKKRKIEREKEKERKKGRKKKGEKRRKCICAKIRCVEFFWCHIDHTLEQNRCLQQPLLTLRKNTRVTRFGLVQVHTLVFFLLLLLLWTQFRWIVLSADWLFFHLLLSVEQFAEFTTNARQLLRTGQTVSTRK